MMWRIQCTSKFKITTFTHSPTFLSRPVVCKIYLPSCMKNMCSFVAKCWQPKQQNNCTTLNILKIHFINNVSLFPAIYYGYMVPYKNLRVAKFSSHVKSASLKSREIIEVIVSIPIQWRFNFFPQSDPLCQGEDGDFLKSRWSTLNMSP